MYSVPCGVFSNSGRGGFGIAGGYLEYHGYFQSVGDIMKNVRNIRSTIWLFSTIGATGYLPGHLIYPPDTLMI